ncbi:MAG: terminase large subunit, partial [Gluconobacter oxydans]
MASDGTVKASSRARKTAPKRTGVRKAVKQAAAIGAAVATLAWSTACPAWEKRIVAGESLIPCAPLFPEAAKQGMDVFNALKLVDV